MSSATRKSARLLDSESRKVEAARRAEAVSAVHVLCPVLHASIHQSQSCARAIWVPSFSLFFFSIEKEIFPESALFFFLCLRPVCLSAAPKRPYQPKFDEDRA